VTVLQKIQKYWKETLAELRKMTWPTKDELLGSTIVTVVVSVIVAIFIGIVDRILLFVITRIFDTGAGA
jgi:preprotein translocase subunit SecE